MPLDAGIKLGPYEVLGPLGAGGMGEVYQATDTRLGRTVAIKVLPSHFSEDSEMKQRFDREARTVAALNHPNICTLHDIGRSEITSASGSKETIDYLVMEHLEGETLAERISRGPIPLNEALKIAVQIADGLEKAHSKGVTHRDLKPGNVMLTPGGAKLLDFGLAKLQVPALAETSDSETQQTGTPSTTPGTIMGTMQYMAPEQLEGREADARADIFAFGAVLYEMVTGRKAFPGKSKAHLIAAILSTEPEPVSNVVPSAPPVLDFLLSRCLEKDPDERLQTATDLVWELRWVAGGGTAVVKAVPTGLERPVVERARPWALGIVGLLVLTLGILAWTGPGRAEADTVTRFTIDVPDMPVAEAVSISPDGRTLAFSARDGGSAAVFVRPMTVDVAQRLTGTDGAQRLFWSPDSRWIAFFANGQLKRVDAVSGTPQNIADIGDLRGGTWNADDEILFGSSDGLFRVRAGGGQPQPVPVDLPEGAGIAQEPWFLPDGRHFLFLAAPEPSGDAASAPGAIYAASLDSPDVTHLVDVRSNPVYVEPGYLLFHQNGTLFAQAFNADALQLEGERVRMADGLPVGQNGAAAFAASDTGTLLYRNSPDRDPVRSGVSPNSVWTGAEPPLLWFERNAIGGSGSETAGAAGPWIGVDVTADGGRAAVHRHDPEGGDIWIFEARDPTPTRFTFDGTQDNSSPIWSPDATRIAFGSRRGGRWGIYVKLADLSRDAELVLESDGPVMPMSWSPDGVELIYSVENPRTRGDIYRVAVETETGADPEPIPVVETAADERNPQVSPDGRWIAYSSNQSGQSEIYIQPYPEGPGRIQVSVDGGVFPRWRGDSREIVFLNQVSIGALMRSVLTVEGTSIRRATPERIGQTLYIIQDHTAGPYHAYAMAADGARVLMPAFENANAALALGSTPGVAQARVGAAVASDRLASVGSTASSGPITIVLDWPVAAR